MTNEMDDLPAVDVNEVEDPAPNAHQYQFPDEFLRRTVNTINDAVPAARIGMTLVVGGQVVSGEACGLGEYLEAQIQVLEGLRADGVPVVDELAGIYRESQDLEAEENPWEWPFHVHLINARVGGQLVGPWRGRLVEVSGWSLGAPE